MKRIIITGAGGFIGSELTRKYVEAGYQVLAISDMFNPEFPNSDLITKISVDITSPDILLRAIDKANYEAFYHLAWRGVNGPEKADPQVQTDNIKMALVCATVAHEIGCKKFLCAGTIAERSVESLDNISKTSGGMLYGISKYCTHLMLETYCKNIGLDFVWMQFSNIYGPKNKTGNLVSYTLGMLKEDKEATFGPAIQPYDFIYIDDLIDAAYKLGTSKTNRNIYFIGSGKPRILKEYLYQIGRECGKEEYIKIGERADDGIVYSYEMFDTSSLVNDIGNYIKYDFDSGIKKTILEY